MAIFTRQLLVNKIDLPGDMLNVIKDYAFIDMVSHASKSNKDIVNNVIQNALVSCLRNIIEDEIEEAMVAEEVEEVCEEFCIRFFIILFFTKNNSFCNSSYGYSNNDLVA